MKATKIAASVQEAYLPDLENFEETAWSRKNMRPAPLAGLDLRKLATTKPKPCDFVIPGLRRGSAGIFASPGGVGKSYLILEICVQIASGVQFLGFETKQGRVVYVSNEDDEEALHGRFHAIVDEFLPNEADREKLYKNLIIHCPTPGDIDLLTTPEWLDAACYGTRLLVVDTMRLAHSGDENCPVAMSKFVASIILYARRHKTSIALLAHSTKSSALNGLAELAQSLRGSSVLTDNFRWQSYMVGMTIEEADTLKCTVDDQKIGAENYDKYVRFGISKTNYGPKGKPKWFFRGDNGVLHPCEVERLKNSAPTKKNKGFADYAQA
jgi:RecA-family ATPase